MDTDFDQTEARLRPRVLTGQILAGAMIAGVLAFGVIVVAMNANEEAGPEGLNPAAGVALEGAEADVEGGQLDADLEPGDPLLSYLALAAAVVALIAYKPVGGLIAGGATDGGAGEAAGAGAFQTRLIVRLAILEGAAILNLFALLIEDWWPLWLVVGTLLIAMLTEVPTAGRLRRYLEGRAQLAALEPVGRD